MESKFSYRQENKKILQKFLKGQISVDEVYDYMNSLPYDEALKFEMALRICCFILKKMLNEVNNGKI